jgi:hypothetical protein
MSVERGKIALLNMGGQAGRRKALLGSPGLKNEAMSLPDQDEVDAPTHFEETETKVTPSANVIAEIGKNATEQAVEIFPSQATVPAANHLG